jgi:cobalt-zinc-cadmium efflux system outer membrane protein
MISRISLLIFLATGALAAPPPLTLDSIASRVRSANPDLAAARLRIAEAHGRLVQSGRLSNPEVEFDYNRNTASPREHTLGVTLLQRLPITARLRYEKAVSQAQLAAAEAEVADVERKLIAQARTAAVKLVALRVQRDLRTRQLTNSREQSVFLLKRAETGEASLTDAVQVDLEARMLDADLLQLRVEETTLLGELRPLLGLTSADALAVDGELTAPAAPSGSHGDRPDVQAAQHTATAAQAQAAKERASRFEDVTLGLVYERERAEDAPEGLRTDQMLGVKFNIPLPLWNNNAGRIQEAEATAQRAAREVEAKRFEARAEADAAGAEMTALAKLLADFDASLLPKVAELEERLRQSYAAGQSPLTETLRARDRRLQLQRQRLDALRDYHLARVRYEAAIGRIGSK